jgi:hypothetical protein
MPKAAVNAGTPATATERLRPWMYNSGWDQRTQGVYVLTAGARSSPQLQAAGTARSR